MLCLDLCLVVPSGKKIICEGELRVGNVWCLNIDSLWPVRVVGSSWKGFLVKMFWFLPPGSINFVFHCVV